MEQMYQLNLTEGEMACLQNLLVNRLPDNPGAANLRSLLYKVETDHIVLDQE